MRNNKATSSEEPNKNSQDEKLDQLRKSLSTEMKKETKVII
jgi:hypothetical protein